MSAEIYPVRVEASLDPRLSRGLILALIAAAVLAVTGRYPQSLFGRSPGMATTLAPEAAGPADGVLPAAGGVLLIVLPVRQASARPGHA